jgi:shikimate kinase
VEIARRAGRAAGTVLSERGEAEFRRLEAREVRRAAARRGVVVAVGGGALEDARGADALRASGTVVRLDVSAAEAARRVAADAAPRPRLTAAEDLASEMEALIARREAGTARVASRRVSTEDRSPAEVADEVARLAIEDGLAIDGPP